LLYGQPGADVGHQGNAVYLPFPGQIVAFFDTPSYRSSGSPSGAFGMIIRHQDPLNPSGTIYTAWWHLGHYNPGTHSMDQSYVNQSLSTGKTYAAGTLLGYQGDIQPISPSSWQSTATHVYFAILRGSADDCANKIDPSPYVGANVNYSTTGTQYGTPLSSLGQGGGSVSLSISWGAGLNGTGSGGLTLNRKATVEVRLPGSPADVFGPVAITTDQNGNYSGLSLTGIAPGAYDVYLWPTGFLRQGLFSTRLNSGANNLSFSLVRTGTDCCTGKPRSWPMAGDVNRDNVLNTEDYNVIVNYIRSGSTLPPTYFSVLGPSTMSDIDLNYLLRSFASNGCRQGEIGDGGRVDGGASGVVVASRTASAQPGGPPLPPAPAHPSPLGRSGPPAGLPKLVRSPVVGKPQGGGSETLAAQGAATHPGSTRGAAPALETRPKGTGVGTIGLFPASGSFQIGDPITLSIYMDSGGQMIDGADVVLHYDPAVLAVTQMPTTTALGAVNIADNSPEVGEIDISATANSGTSISGTFATIEFSVIGSGTTSITVDYVPGSTARSGMPEDQAVGQVLGQVVNATYNAATLRVPQDYTTIQQALQSAVYGDTVLLAPNTYSATGLQIPDGVTLEGTDPMTTIIDVGGVSNTSIVYLGNESTVFGLTLQNGGSQTFDSAVWAESSGYVIGDRILNASMGVVYWCYSTPCSDDLVVAADLIAHIANDGILVHGTLGNVLDNTVVDTGQQGITFEATGAQGTLADNILTNNQTAVSATADTTLTRNEFFNNAANYASGTTAGDGDFVADPLFVNANADDYHLHAASPARTYYNGESDIGAYPFEEVGTPPSNPSVVQNGNGAIVSWSSTGASGYLVSVAVGTGYFTQPVDAGAATSLTLPSSAVPLGDVTFAISGYGPPDQESDATYLTTTITTPPSTANSTIVPSPANVPADGTTTSTVTVTLLDANNQPVSGQAVTLAGNSGSHSTITTLSGTTNAAGQATFSVIDSTAEPVTYTATDTTDGVTISPSQSEYAVFRPVGALDGDVNLDGTVATYDGLCVVRLVLMFPSIPTCPQEPANLAAADVNRDGLVATYDGLCVVRIVLQFPSIPTCPTTGGGASSSNAAGGRAAMAQLAGAPVTLDLAWAGSADGAGRRTTVDVTADSGSAGLGSWTIEIAYNPKTARVVSCRAAGGSLCNGSYREGAVAVGGFSVTGLTGKQTLATITFESLTGTGGDSKPTIARASLTNPLGGALTTTGAEVSNGGPVAP
jgi:hypothetical protein